jgi:hypothetical protein
MKQIKYLLALTAVLVIFWSQVLSAENGPDSVLNTYKIKSPSEAVARAIEYIGSEKLSDISVKSAEQTAELVEIKDDNTPYFHRIINSGPVWRVQFPNIRLTDSRMRDSIDTYFRTFTALIDPKTGNLLKIHSIRDDYDTSVSPLPSAEIAESQFQRAGRQYYLGCPGIHPPITFWNALQNTYANPLYAGEIIGVYVLFSRMDSEPIPVWAIDLRGIPARPTFHINGDKYVPEYKRNHLRTVIDAKTRHQIFSDPGPQPELRLEDRIIAPKDRGKTLEIDSAKSENLK